MTPNERIVAAAWRAVFNQLSGLPAHQSLSVLMAFVEADPGQSLESPGVIRRMFGFVTPSSTV